MRLCIPTQEGWHSDLRRIHIVCLTRIEPRRGTTSNFSHDDILVPIDKATQAAAALKVDGWSFNTLQSVITGPGPLNFNARTRAVQNTLKQRKSRWSAQFLRLRERPKRMSLPGQHHKQNTVTWRVRDQALKQNNMTRNMMQDI